jgi:glycosyltransferase involved in cell wall biosynthesis
MIESPPRVSVIVPAFHSDATVEAFLAGLERQSYRDFELILVDSSPHDRTERIVRDGFPWVVLERSPERLLPHAARNRGAELARGELLAFTDPDCIPRPDWLGRLVAAHDAGHPVVGGAIELDGGGPLERGIHWYKFAWWLAGGPAGPRPDLASANLMYARGAWAAAGPLQGDRFCGDTVLNWSAQARGYSLWFEPEAAVDHLHTSSLRGFWRECVRRGRDFGSTRPVYRGWSRVRLAAYVVGMPFLPVVKLWRAARYARRSGRLAEFFRQLPLQVLGHVGWCVGEAGAHLRLLAPQGAGESPPG